MGKYTKRWEARKPKKPIRPLPPFANFILNYAPLAESKSHGPEFFQEALRVWKSLDNQNKELFKNRDAMEEYNENMAEYKRVTTAMKQPPYSFGLFVKWYWKTKNPRFDGSRKHFGLIQKQISRSWKALSEDEKEVYKSGSKLLKSLFEAEQAVVLGGDRELNLNWQNEGMERIRPMLYNDRRNPEAANEEMEMELDQQEQEEEEEVEEDYTEYDDGMGDVDAEFDRFS